jgi:RNA polymerase sigma-70 factor (ECF subfamily)
MQAEFAPTTWKACWELVVEEKSAAEVAVHLGISENAVYIAKCRVLGHLRRDLGGLVD